MPSSAALGPRSALFSVVPSDEREQRSTVRARCFDRTHSLKYTSNKGAWHIREREIRVFLHGPNKKLQRVVCFFSALTHVGSMCVPNSAGMQLPSCHFQEVVLLNNQPTVAFLLALNSCSNGAFSSL